MRVAGYRPRPPAEVAAPPEPQPPLLRWDITVRGWKAQTDGYGDTRWVIRSETPATIYAADKEEVTRKVEAAFNATLLSAGYGRNETTHKSHTWVLNRVDEEAPR